MRLRRFSFLAGWVAVILLAAAGFAAFGTSQDAANDLEYEAAAASLGHTAGTYAGLTFALFADAPAETTVAGSGETTVATEEAETALTSDASSSTGTIASPAGWLSEVQVRALVSEYFKAEDVNTAVRIAWCESRFDPEAVNLRTGAVGLFQHLPQYWEDRAASAGFPGADATDPQASTAAAAWAVYDGAGWDIFGCRA
ncbi:MAG: transglycosylase SLT domain-containing protein [Acidimicrobiia bacterium]